MGTAYSKKLLVLYILDICQKYTDEEHKAKPKGDTGNSDAKNMK